MANDYFANCVTEETVKKRYRELASIHHPDRGGKLEVMQEINRQYNIKKQNPAASSFAKNKYAGPYTTAQASYEDIFGDLFKWNQDAAYQTMREALKKDQEERRKREQEAAEKKKRNHNAFHEWAQEQFSEFTKAQNEGTWDAGSTQQDDYGADSLKYASKEKVLDKKRKRSNYFIYITSLSREALIKECMSQWEQNMQDEK